MKLKHILMSIFYLLTILINIEFIIYYTYIKYCISNINKIEKMKLYVGEYLFNFLPNVELITYYTHD